MASDQPSFANILSDIRDGREGVQFERMFRALSYILRLWQDYTGRPSKPNAPQEKLNAIQFDKLVIVVARLWNEMFARTGAPLRRKLQSDTLNNEEHAAVTFPCPLQELPGKHGRGMAVYDSKEAPDFVTAVLFKLEKEGILNYFHILPPLGPEYAGKDLSVHASDPRTTVEPALPIPNAKLFLKDFMPREQDVLLDLGQALRKLSPTQLRALGTHADQKKTIADIQKEYEYLDRQKILDQLVDRLQRGIEFGELAQELLEYLDEACRKSGGNRDNYATARSSMIADLTDPQLNEVFQNCHADPAAIWDGKELVQLRARARRGRSLAHYLVLLASHSTHKGTHAEKAFLDAHNEAKQCGFAGLPCNIQDAFDKSTVTLRPELIACLIKGLGVLKEAK